MANHPNAPDPIVGLTLRFLDGQLSDAEVQALADNLRADQALVDRFVEICLQEQLVADMGAAGLHDDDPDADVSTSVMLDIIQRERDERLKEAAAAAKLTPAETTPPRRPPAMAESSVPRVIVIPSWAVYGSIAAAILIAASIFYTAQPSRQAPISNPVAENQAPQAHAPSPVASLTRVHSAVWAGPDGQPTTTLPGPLLAGTELELLDGLAEVQMGDGAVVYLQGPAAIHVDSPGSIRLDRGRLTAKVNDGAEGFEIWTPQSQIIDHGTEFGVSVGDSGHERAEVFSGRVTLKPVSNESEAGEVTLRGGQGLAISTDGSTRDISSHELNYVRDLEFEALLLAENGSAYHRWLAYTYVIRRDPAVVAYYVFDEADVGRNRLVNHAAGPRVAGDAFLGDGGNISPPEWADGRFEQTRALSFGIDPHGDCRGAIVPDSDALDFTGEMTIAAWVRFDRSTSAWNTVLSKRDIPPANLNYQLSVSGQWYEGHCRFQFGTGIDTEATPGFDETPSTQRGDTADWQHIAVVSDGTTLRYYINGECVTENSQPMAPAVNDAPLLIGTSSSELRPPLQNGLRPFNGRISELLLARRAYADRDILELYEAGRPQQ